MSNIKVSVIIPVYNVEKYLEQCLLSVINQTLDDIEIICVDDGSTDNSSNILKDYSKKDSRVKVIRQKNAGLGAARNTGLKYVKGEYISFIDSDDWFDEKALEHLYFEAVSKDTDIIIFKMKTFNEDTGEVSNTFYYDLSAVSEYFTNSTYNYRDFGKKFFEMTVNAYNKLYKRDFLERINLKFPEGYIFEDHTFFFESMLNAKKVLLSDNYFIFRRIRDDSIITSYDRRYFDAIPITNKILDIFKKYDLFEDYKMELINHKLMIIELTYEDIDNEYKEEYLTFIKNDFKKSFKNYSADIESFIDGKLKLFYFNALKASSPKELILLNEISDLKTKITHLKNNNAELMLENKKCKSKINEIYSTLSWKITKPIRTVKLMLNKV